MSLRRLTSRAEMTHHQSSRTGIGWLVLVIWRKEKEAAAARITTNSVAMDGSFMVCEMKYGGVLYSFCVCVSHQISRISCMNPNPAFTKSQPARISQILLNE